MKECGEGMKMRMLVWVESFVDLSSKGTRVNSSEVEYLKWPDLPMPPLLMMMLP